MSISNQTLDALADRLHEARLKTQEIAPLTAEIQDLDAKTATPFKNAASSAGSAMASESWDTKWA